MKTYAWKYMGKDAGGLHFSPDPNPPPIEEEGCPWELLYEIETATWEEAMAIHHLRQGFEPYKPAGEDAECPTCGAIYYPHGSGVCWRGHGSDTAKEDAGAAPDAGGSHSQGA